MKSMCAIMFSLMLCGVASAVPPLDGKTKLALELMDVTHADRSVRTLMQQMPAMMEQSFKSLETCDEAKPIVEQFSKDISAKLGEILLSDDFRIDTAAIYAEVFSEEELKQLVAFYKTSLGEKLIERMPDLMQKSMQMSQKRVTSAMPDISKIGAEYGQRVEKACKASETTSPIVPNS